MESVSPTLAGGFLFTGPPGKSTGPLISGVLAAQLGFPPPEPPNLSFLSFMTPNHPPVLQNDRLKEGGCGVVTGHRGS